MSGFGSGRKCFFQVLFESAGFCVEERPVLGVAVNHEDLEFALRGIGGHCGRVGEDGEVADGLLEVRGGELGSSQS